jgi:hypothetical protein
MFYLNEDYEGGETAFLDKNNLNKTIITIKPKRGMMIFFPQDIYHEGKAVIGEKFIFRNDIVYKRDFEKEGRVVTEEDISTQKKALNYLNMAQELERCGQGREAVEYYKKAFTDEQIKLISKGINKLL